MLFSRILPVAALALLHTFSIAGDAVTRQVIIEPRIISLTNTAPYIFDGNRFRVSLNLQQDPEFRLSGNAEVQVKKNGAVTLIPVAGDLTFKRTRPTQVALNPISGGRHDPGFRLRASGDFLGLDGSLRVSIPGEGSERFRLQFSPQITEHGIDIQITPIQRTSDIILGDAAVKLPGHSTSFHLPTVQILGSRSSLIVGGLAGDDQLKIRTEVPLLSNLPQVGNLFKSKFAARDESNLLIIIPARIIIEREP